MRRRRKAREFALRILYQSDITKEDPRDIISTFWRHKSYPEDIRLFTERLVRDTVENIETIDHLIEESSEHWHLERIGIVERNILRIAVNEFLSMDDIPHNVTIDEAIEIAKRFGTDDSAGFVNGILDKIKKEIEKENLIDKDKDPLSRVY
ncbi:MAG: transcription antitermination factor NusB [Nitrospinae bacterium]|nr:transcription antitermination factor NusB [Nitrospinota bacterium]